MTDILVAAELEPLLDPTLLGDATISWVSAEKPVPAGDFTGFIPLLSRPVGAAEMDRLPDLRIVANCAVGYDNVDVAEATRRGIVVTNTPDVLTESTADLAWALILAATRRMKEAAQFLVDGKWQGWDPRLLLGMELRGRTLGLIGAGRIGQAVGRRARGFGMSVIYADRVEQLAFAEETGAARVELNALLARADVVSVHVPHTKETIGLLGAREFAAMKEGTVVVNTARGGIVDEEALLAAVDDGRLLGAGLDVFEDEPRVRAALTAHPRIVCLPHVASATWDTRRAMANLAARNVAAVLAGRPPLTSVSR